MLVRNPNTITLPSPPLPSLYPKHLWAWEVPILLIWHYQYNQSFLHGIINIIFPLCQPRISLSHIKKLYDFT